jgi:hypothetical protein
MSISASFLWQNRHGTWYFRAVIPFSVRDSFPGHSREIRRSLRTANRAKESSFQVEQTVNRVDLHRSGLEPQGVSVIEQTVGRCEHLEEKWFSSLSRTTNQEPKQKNAKGE